MIWSVRMTGLPLAGGLWRQPRLSESRRPLPEKLMICMPSKLATRWSFRHLTGEAQAPPEPLVPGALILLLILSRLIEFCRQIKHRGEAVPSQSRFLAVSWRPSEESLWDGQKSEVKALIRQHVSLKLTLRLKLSCILQQSVLHLNSRGKIRCLSRQLRRQPISCGCYSKCKASQKKLVTWPHRF